MADFDKVVLEIGYQKLVVPKKVAMAFFEMVSGNDVYIYDSSWESVNGTSMAVPYVKAMEYDRMPSIHAINPVTFMSGIENQKTKDLEEKRKAK